MVVLPLHSTRTPNILQVFQKGYVAYFGPLTHNVCDQNTEQLNIKVIFVSPTNHKSLLAETWDKEFVKFVGKTFD